MDGSCSPSHIPGSMVLVYMLTWLGYIDGIHVTIYSIHGSYGIWQIISFDLSPLCDILLYLWGERWDSVPTSNKAYTEHWDLYRSSFFNALRELFLGGPVGPGQFWWRVSASVCENICCKFAGFSCLRIMAFSAMSCYINHFLPVLFVGHKQTNRPSIPNHQQSKSIRKATRSISSTGTAYFSNISDACLRSWCLSFRPRERTGIKTLDFASAEL